MSETIILVEGSDDYEILNNIISANKNAKVISFDFLAHKSLVHNKKLHCIVEEYFDKEDSIQIDDLALEFALKWHKQQELVDFLQYAGLNLGSLLELELPGYFGIHLKRFLGIIRIVERENPRKIISSSLSNYITEICADKKIEIVTIGTKKIMELYFDTVEIPITINGKTISLKISRKHFLQIKNTAETFINCILNVKPRVKKIQDKKSILLLDFNPSMYEELLKELSLIDHNIILLNQRRPAIWNFKSFTVVKNSKSKIIRLDDFTDNTVKEKIKKETEIINNQIYLLFAQDNIFQNLFKINDMSFWEVIKDNFKEIIKNRFKESVRRIILFNEILDKINISSILEWAHTGMEEKIAIHLANKRSIPVVFLQHGLYTQSPKLEKYIHISPILPSHGAKEAIWGKIFQDYLLEHNVNKKDIIITGSPRHDIFFKKRSVINNKNTILIAGNGFFDTNFNGRDTRAYDYLDDCIIKILETLKKIPDKKPIIKLHPGRVYYDIKPLIQKIDPTISIYQNQNIMDLLESCDVMISLNFSTVILDAMILNKPVLLILPEKQGFEEEPLVKRETVLYVKDLDKIESAIHDILFNKKIREILIQNGKEFIDSYFENQGNASNSLSNVLRNL